MRNEKSNIGIGDSCTIRKVRLNFRVKEMIKNL
jgi:hypothetical protein